MLMVGEGILSMLAAQYQGRYLFATCLLPESRPVYYQNFSAGMLLELCYGSILLICVVYCPPTTALPLLRPNSWQYFLCFACSFITCGLLQFLYFDTQEMGESRHAYSRSCTAGCEAQP
jgi:hypothetical protein